MEIHFAYGAPSDEDRPRNGLQDDLERQVRVMERLRERFRVLGSTIETYRQGWYPEKNCPEQQCAEPVLHSAGGYGLSQFAVGYVNKDLL